jgi:hypothetical protein
MFGLGSFRLPTRAELKVILFSAATACIGLGVFAIVAGIRAPVEKVILAHQAIFYGGASIFFGVVFVICLWILCRFSDET